MTFQRNIPKPEDLISISQDNLLQNFQAINDSYKVNHVLFNLAGDGKHKFVEMPNQSTPAAAAGEMTIWSDVSGGQSELFFKRDAGGNPVQISGPDPVTGVDPDFAGFSFLPGNILIQWVRLSQNNQGSRGKNDGAAITFPISFAAGSTPFSVQLTASRDGNTTLGLFYTSLLRTGFTLRVSTNANTHIDVLAVGLV